MASAAAWRGAMELHIGLRGRVMHSEPHTGDIKHQKPRHLAERFEGMVGFAAVAAIVLLAIGLIYGVLTTGSATPNWMQ